MFPSWAGMLIGFPAKSKLGDETREPADFAIQRACKIRSCTAGGYCLPCLMSFDLQAINTDELKARVGELRRYL